MLTRFGCGLVYVALATVAMPLQAQVLSEQIEIVQRDHAEGSNVVTAPNTPQAEELAVMPWIVRNGSGFTTSYLFKDRNQFNAITLDTLSFFGIREDGVEVRYFHRQFPNCTETINDDMRFYHVGFGLGPDFDGYPIGARIKFRWRAVFRNPGCSNRVTKNQYFELIKGEPLPVYTGQYPSSLHNHSFYTDNLGEYGGSKESIPQFWVVGGRIYLWTDHGYDFTATECTQMVTDAGTFSNTNVLVIPGSEGNIDTDTNDDVPDDFLHTLTNTCLRTPWEFPGDNSSPDLWPLQQFQDDVAARGAFWAAAHPFTSFDVPGINGPLGLWQPSHITQAMADPNFVGWQIWNRPRSSTREDAGNLDTINPYPWVTDPNANQGLEFGLAQVDAIQQAYLAPFRRANLLAGTDDHWDRAYTHTLNGSGQVEVHNSALGKCFTVTEQLAFTTPAFAGALADGKLYLTNGPGCRFGVDLDNDGDLETTFGQNHLNPTGVIRLLAQSNNEFGPFQRAILYRITPTTRDSLIVPLSGMNVSPSWPVSVVPTGPAAVRARLETSGGYGDAPGLVLTGWLYFNASTVSVEPDQLSVRFDGPWPNPASGTVRWAITLAQPQFTSVNILDPAGRRVAAIFAGLVAGYQPFSWDGTDQLGHRLPAGLYLVEIRTAQHRHTRKLLLLP